MDDDRKYKQRGYMDTGYDSGGRNDLPEGQEPRSPRPSTSPARVCRAWWRPPPPRAATLRHRLPADYDFTQECPKCKAALHCCKQCTYFEPSTRFQCTKPIPERIASKDKANECTFFRVRVTVARDSAPPPSMIQGNGRPDVAAPKTANDARIAFDNLFKK
jgi:hypothetical protein